MSLSIGIVGLPNVGKSTLFNSLTNAGALAANYPFATIEPNIGIVPVPDTRLNVLAKMYNCQKITPATVSFVDIAGLVAGASSGEGLGNKFLANIRECNAIVHVIRGFSDKNVIHVSNKINPKNDIEIITTELILADLQTLENHLPKLIKESRSDPNKKHVVNYVETLINHLKSGTPLNKLPDLDNDVVLSLNLLTSKPVIYVFNIDEEVLNSTEKQKELSSLVYPTKSVFISAKLEEELASLDDNDKQELLESYNISESGLNQLAKASYDILGLQSYLTAGEKEVRAWTIHKGDTAPQAAGVIHGDFERGFIAASIVDYEDLVSCGSEQAAKSAGKMRLEGRDYIMQPSDVVEFRFNVSK
jgi:GTP-binding protein YchF